MSNVTHSIELLSQLRDNLKSNQSMAAEEKELVLTTIDNVIKELVTSRDKKEVITSQQLLCLLGKALKYLPSIIALVGKYWSN